MHDRGASSKNTYKPDEPVLLVDIGGGRGQIIEDVRKKRPILKERMIVQDLSQEIEGRAPVEGVEPMSYDFFTPQPVKDGYSSPLWLPSPIIP